MLKTKYHNVLNRLDDHTLEVIKKSSASMVIKVGGMFVGLGVSIFLGRTIGAEGLGIINLANRIVGLLLILAMFGFDQVLVKNIAIAFENKTSKHIADSIFTSSLFNGLLSFSIAIIGILVTPYLVEQIFHEPELEIPLIIALAVMIPQTFSRIHAAGLIGLRKIWQSSLINETLSTFVVGLCLFTFYILNLPFNVVEVAMIYAIGRITVTTAIVLYWKKLFVYKGKKAWNGTAMFKMARPMVLVSATTIVASSTDVIMLGWLSNASEVGLYSVCARISILTSFFLQVSNAAISPKLAALYANKQMTEMNKMVHLVTGGLMIIAFVSLLFFVLGGEVILGLWGDEFKEAYAILIILGIGQFINTSTGCAGLLLIMCGHERAHGIISLFSVILNFLLNYVLISKFGAVGAAIATATVVAGENIAKLFIAKVRIGILTVPFISNKIQ